MRLAFTIKLTEVHAYTVFAGKHPMHLCVCMRACAKLHHAGTEQHELHDVIRVI